MVVGVPECYTVARQLGRGEDEEVEGTPVCYCPVVFGGGHNALGGKLVICHVERESGGRNLQTGELFFRGLSALSCSGTIAISRSYPSTRLTSKKVCESFPEIVNSANVVGGTPASAHSSFPPQSPVRQVPSFVVSSNVQFVRPQTRPIQSQLTVTEWLEAAGRWKPAEVELPLALRTPGHIE